MVKHVARGFGASTSSVACCNEWNGVRGNEGLMAVKGTRKRKRVVNFSPKIILVLDLVAPPYPYEGRHPEKCCCSFGFCPNEAGEEGSVQIFCHLFKSAFLVNKMSLLPPKCQ